MFKHRLSINSRDAPEKRRRHHYNTTSHITRLSDELFLRIVHHLSTRDLAAFQVVNKRCARIAVDGQVWKALYYRRFVRPRASRIPGVLRDAGNGKLHYSSKNSRWLEEDDVARSTGTDWKRLYKLRHNWSIGSCGINTIDISGTGYKFTPSLQGILFTADASRGLCAWRVRGTQDSLIAEGNLYKFREEEPDGLFPAEVVGTPTALAVDEESGIAGSEGTINVTVGFSNGGFQIHQLDMVSEKLPVFRLRYIHKETGILGIRPRAITSMAVLGPYISTMRSQTWTIYDFSQSSDRSSHPLAGAGQIAPQAIPTTRYRMMPSLLHAPQILESLESCTSWPPLSLSLRRSVNRCILASIVFTYPLFGTGWSVGIQELRFSTSYSGRGSNRTLLEGSRIAATTKPGFSPIINSPRSFSAAATSGSSSPISGSNQARGCDGPGSWHGSQQEDPPLARPTSLSYCHPYLLTSHSDNTLTLFLITSSDRTLSIDPGQRLHGHTSAVTAAQVNGRGKAVSISSGSELRLWDLEGGVSERRRVNASVRVEPSHDVVCDTTESAENAVLGGFDEERVVVLKNTSCDLNALREESTAVATANTLPSSTAIRTVPEATGSDTAIMIYDFTR
ncbi:hypothetical protein EDC01DRAFT_617762 [Geopyxis carbonaria]|nr:hypothetical protein EDC01DRAFT_617762 [Geopyxis carbonaria]